MSRPIRFLSAIAVGCAVLAPAAMGDGAGPLPPAPAAKPAPAKPGPLQSGRSAGIRAAQQNRTGLALIGAGGAIIAVIAVAAGSSGGNGAAQPQSQSAVVTTS